MHAGKRAHQYNLADKLMRAEALRHDGTGHRQLFLRVFTCDIARGSSSKSKDRDSRNTLHSLFPLPRKAADDAAPVQLWLSGCRLQPILVCTGDLASEAPKHGVDLHFTSPG